MEILDQIKDNTTKEPSKDVIVLHESKKTINAINKKINLKTFRKKLRDRFGDKVDGLSDAEIDELLMLESRRIAISIVEIGIGIITFADFIVPDPVLGIDEACLTAATAYLEHRRRKILKREQEVINGNLFKDDSHTKARDIQSEKSENNPESAGINSSLFKISSSNNGTEYLYDEGKSHSSKTI